MIQDFAQAFLLVFVAEMGDKSQLLAMTFATRYPIKKVLIGILIGAFLNDGLAVLLGSLVSSFVPMNAIQVIAGLAFIVFALWSLKVEEDEEDTDHRKIKFGPVVTVATAYFIGEFGDKTQLTAIALASDAVSPLAVLIGTVLGMFATGSIGIYIGKKLGDRMPEMAIKLVSAAMFLFFGITKLAQSLPSKYLTPLNIFLFFIALAAALALLARPLILARKQGRESALVKRSRELHEYYSRIKSDFDSICLGTEKCGRCQGNKCIVGYTKTLIKYCLDEKSPKDADPSSISQQTLSKPFSKEQAAESLLMTLKVLKDDPENSKLRPIHEIRKNLERILFGKSVDRIKDWKEYEKALFEIDESVAASIVADLKNN
jgi:putative Ca2+/H+ antiporter (TMEM165/GDT1 family)